MSWEFLVGWRYLRTKRKEKLISVTTFLSIVSVTIGVAALIIVLGVMNGFGDELRQRIVGFNYHIHIERAEGINNPEEVIGKLKGIDGIKEAFPFIDGQAIILAETKTTRGILVRGMDAAAERPSMDIKMQAGSFDLKADEVAFGNELADLLGIGIGDEVSLISGARTLPTQYKVAAIFHSGMYEYDANVAFMNLDAAKLFFDTNGSVHGIGVRIQNLDLAADIKKAIHSVIGREYLVNTWSELNRNLFAAIKMEKILVFIVVTLTIAVGALNIINTLSLLTLEKTKDIGILKALGATRFNIAKIYMFKGLVIGLLGSSLGLLIGYAVTRYINQIADFISRISGFELFSREIYYLDKIPVSTNYLDVWTIIFFAVGLSFLATLYPAIHASKLDPIEALRYE